MPPKKGETEQIAEPKPVAESKPKRKTTKKTAKKAAEKPAEAPAETKAESDSGTKKRRGLYSNSRRTLSASELAKLGIE